MRRALRQRLPALSRIYGLRPGDVDAMPYAELAVYVADLNRIESGS